MPFGLGTSNICPFLLLSYSGLVPSQNILQHAHQMWVPTVQPQTAATADYAESAISQSEELLTFAAADSFKSVSFRSGNVPSPLNNGLRNLLTTGQTASLTVKHSSCALRGRSHNEMVDQELSRMFYQSDFNVL